MGLLTGAARFGADLEHPLLEGAAHVVFVRSTIAHGRLTSVDVDEARDAPGVLAVITADDHDVIPTGSIIPAWFPSRFAMPLLAEQKVRFVGEPIAAVVAETAAQATDAAELVIIDYDPLPAVIALDDAATDTVLLFDGTDTARSRTRDSDTRNPPTPTNTVAHHVDPHDPAPFAAADVTISQRFTNPRQVPAPIEPIVEACVWTPDGQLHVWASTQRPHGFRDQLCELFDLSTDEVHVTAPTAVGGGFGGKISRTQEEHALAVIARMVDRPVRWVQTRTEYLQAATHGRGEQFDLRLAGDRDGTIRAVRADTLKDAGAYPSTGATLPGRFNSPNASGAYAIPHVEFDAVSVVTNAPQISAFRGAGRGPWIAALERAVDMFAAAIDLDPAEVRRRNLVAASAMPYRSATGGLYDDADYPTALERTLELARYDELRREQAERRAAGDTVQVGIGIAAYNLLTVGSGAEEARVVIRPDGGATVYTGTSDQGQGHSATWAQIASARLQIPMDRIAVREGSTAYTRSGVGAIGSRSIQTAGIAVLNASDALVELAREQTAARLEASPADIVLAPVGASGDNGDDEGGEARFHVAGVPSRSVGWAELAVDAQHRGTEMSCADVHDIGDDSTFPSGCHLAVVEVDTETGGVVLREFHGVDDVGVRLNPVIVEGQLHGGIASGVSQVLGEVMVYDDDGTPLTTNFLDYPLITADRVPQWNIEALETPSSFNELGVKGVGESGVVGAVPAVHNAIVDAVAHLGVRHIELPCTPMRIWSAVAAAGGVADG